MLFRNIKKFKIENYKDDRGLLSVFSSKKNKFKIKRVYLIENKKKNVIRGKHSRIIGAKYYFCCEGKVSIKLSFKNKTKTINLSKGEIVKVDSKFWIEITFNTINTRCLVFDNREYNENEYIRKKFHE